MSRTISITNSIIQYQPGIYILTNTINNKKYVGQSWHLSRRINFHKNNKADSYLHNAIRKSGWESFNIQRIEIPITFFNSTNFDNQYLLNLYENYYIRTLNTEYPYGYNLTSGGSNGKHSEISKIKMSNIRKKLFKDGILTGKNGVDNPMYGRIFTEEERKIMSNKRRQEYKDGIRTPTKYIWSEERTQKQSNTLKTRYKLGDLINPMKGKKRSEESNIKLSKTLKQQYSNNERILGGKKFKGKSWRINSVTGKREWYTKLDIGIGV